MCSLHTEMSILWMHAYVIIFFLHVLHHKSGVTGYAIQQFCEAKFDGYNLTLFPGECENRLL